MTNREPSPEFIKKATKHELSELCKEVRTSIITTVSQHGGHLSSNLGVVELSIALLKCFDPLKDDILFDVGHQSYAYKILTDRSKEFCTLRQEGGLSGFPDPGESPYDKFISGHSSTSLAIATGFSIQKKHCSDPSFTVAVFGDGAITGGEAFESLNAIGHHQLPVIAILNDNEMSISANVGAMAKSFSRFRSSITYHKLRKSYKYHLRQCGKIGNVLEKIGEKAKSMVKQALFPEMFFEEFGFFYLGPVDGHNIPEMCDMLMRAKTIKKPVLIHAYTQKGKGFCHAESNPVLFHSSPSFIIEENGCKTNRSSSSFSSIFGQSIVELGKTNPNVIVLTAAMAEGLEMCNFANLYPDQFYDFGIAEQHLVSSAAAIAHKGLKPIVGIYSTFLQRAYDQIIHDCAILKEAVIFAIDRAGAVSDDGPTHQGIFDIAFLLPVPNTIIMAPESGSELKEMLNFALNQSQGPLFIRYPKDKAPEHPLIDPIRLGKASRLQSGKDLAIIYLGPFRNLALQVSCLLETKGLSTTIINARFAKPFDQEAMLACVNTKLIVTIEDGVLQGGFGQTLSSFYLSQLKHPPSMLTFGHPEVFPRTMKRDRILEDSKISADAIVYEILERMEIDREK